MDDVSTFPHSIELPLEAMHSWFCYTARIYAVYIANDSEASAWMTSLASGTKHMFEPAGRVCATAGL